MCDFPSEEPPNEWKRFLWGGPTVPPFFVGGKRPVGLPDINLGTEIRQGTPPHFKSLFDPTTNTPFFYLAYKVFPDEATKLGTHKRPDLKWKVFDNYLFQDRLEDNLSITQILRLELYPALQLKHAASLQKMGTPSFCYFLNFFRSVS